MKLGWSSDEAQMISTHWLRLNITWSLPPVYFLHSRNQITIVLSSNSKRQYTNLWAVSYLQLIEARSSLNFFKSRALLIRPSQLFCCTSSVFDLHSKRCGCGFEMVLKRFERVLRWSAVELRLLGGCPTSPFCGRDSGLGAYTWSPIYACRR
jgi:hypothetical protein